MQTRSRQPVAVLTGAAAGLSRHTAEALRAISRVLKPRPDRSLANVKFTDDFERELMRSAARGNSQLFN